MSGVRTYRDLIVWQKGIDLVTTIYGLTRNYPASEVYGLTSQIAAVLYPFQATLLKVTEDGSLKKYIRFLQIASGSLFELQTQLQISANLDFIGKDQFSDLENLTFEIDRNAFSINIFN